MLKEAERLHQEDLRLQVEKKLRAQQLVAEVRTLHIVQTCVHEVFCFRFVE
jgi:hypothetical protein